MKELLLPFKQKNTLFHICLCAAVFIGMAVPFKVMVLVEGLTEVRPVNAVPVVAGLLFGPAGAWGCAVGNLISDFFGTFSRASVLGFAGNFAAAYVPYKIWHIIKRNERPNLKSYSNIGLYILITAIASLFTGIIIVCGLDVFFGYWSQKLFNIIVLNDFLFPLFLGLPVLIVLTCDDNKFQPAMPQRPAGYPLLRNISMLFSVIMALLLVVMIYLGFTMSGSIFMLICGALFLISAAGFILF